jgi:hypothetical protein
MSSSASLNCSILSSHINFHRETVMVGCVQCQCLRLECCLLDLLKKCGNCVKNGSTCKLSSTVVDFS